jgi:hypothetical protein
MMDSPSDLDSLNDEQRAAWLAYVEERDRDREKHKAADEPMRAVMIELIELFPSRAARELNRRKLKTALGGDWSGAEVDRVRRRLELPAYAYINRYGAAIWLALIVAGMLIGTLLHYVWPI